MAGAHAVGDALHAGRDHVNRSSSGLVDGRLSSSLPFGARWLVQPVGGSPPRRCWSRSAGAGRYRAQVHSVRLTRWEAGAAGVAGLSPEGQRGVFAGWRPAASGTWARGRAASIPFASACCEEVEGPSVMAFRREGSISGDDFAASKEAGSNSAWNTFQPGFLWRCKCRRRRR